MLRLRSLYTVPTSASLMAWRQGFGQLLQLDQLVVSQSRGTRQDWNFEGTMVF